MQGMTGKTGAAALVAVAVLVFAGVFAFEAKRGGESAPDGAKAEAAAATGGRAIDSAVAASATSQTAGPGNGVASAATAGGVSAGTPEEGATGGAGTEIVAVKPMADSAERERTAEQRRAALPAFIAAAEKDIGQQKARIDAAVAAGAPPAEVGAMQQRLALMESVRAQVLERNRDIVN